MRNIFTFIKVDPTLQSCALLQARDLINRTTSEERRGDRGSLFLVQALDQQYTLLCSAADGSTEQVALQRQCRHLFREWACCMDQLIGPVALYGSPGTS